MHHATIAAHHCLHEAGRDIWGDMMVLMRSVRFAVLAGTGCAALATACSAQAQTTTAPPSASGATSVQPDSAATETGEVIVTAQKRSQRLSQVPAVVSAVSPELLKEQNIRSVIDLDNQVPGLRAVQQTFQVNLQIRGIGNTFLTLGGESGVAFHEDGVYVSRQSSQNSAFYDVERLEVLNGPQGTLYGRNATGGVINLLTKSPTPIFEAGGTVEVGSYSLFTGEGYVSGPLIGDSVEGRVAFKITRRGGYGTNLFNGRPVNNQREEGARAGLKFRLGDSASLLVKGEYYHADDSAGGPVLVSDRSIAGTSLLPFPLPAPNQNVTNVALPGLALGGRTAVGQDINQDTQPNRSIKLYAVSANLDWALSDSLDLKSVTGYRHYVNNLRWDFDATTTPESVTLAQEGSRQFSQELNLNWKIAPGASILFGAYYFQEHQFGFVDTITTHLPLCNLIGTCPAATAFIYVPFTTHFELNGTEETHAYAGFVRGTFDITPKLTLIAAGRYSIERKSTDNFQYLEVIPNCNSGDPTNFSPFRAGCEIVGSHTFRAFTPQGTLQYKFDNNNNVYASVGRGFKSGTYGFGNPGTFINTASSPTLANAVIVPSEKVTSYEIGGHASIADRLITLTAAAFYYDYSNFQTTRLQNTNILAEVIDSATIKGVDAAFTVRPAAGFEVTGQVEILDSRIKKYTADPTAVGNHMQNVPNYSFGVTAKKTFYFPDDSSIALIGSFRKTGTTYYDSNNSLVTGQRPYGLIDASINFHSKNKKIEVSIWGKNLTDKLAYSFKEVQASVWGLPLWGGPIAPRTFGMRVSYAF